MNVSIISFGCSESLNYIYGKLKEHGAEIDGCFVCEQTEEAINEVSALSEGKSQVVIYVGGLGMSSKDVLKNVLTQRYGVDLVYTDKAKSFLQRYENEVAHNALPALVQERLMSFPEGFECFPNNYGYELPAIGRFAGREVILLPDNLSECKYVYEIYLENYFSKRDGETSKHFIFKVFGLEKAEVERRLAVIDKKTFNWQVETDCTNDSKIIVSCKSKTSQTAIDEMNGAMSSAFGDSMYAVDNFSLNQVAIDLLKLAGKKLSVAESLTGGEITSSLIEIAGASDVLFEGCVTYANEAKQARLLVKRNTLSQSGAVSSETVYQMGAGLLKTSGCDIILASTGIAGPGGGTDKKPVGLTYLAVGDAKGIHIHKFVFSGTRNVVRKKAANTAIFLLINYIKKHF